MHSPIRQYLTHALEPPSRQFWLGTDDLGRDLLARLLYGGRVTLLVCGIAVGVSIGVGTSTGVLCGVMGGRLDLWVMHLVNAVLAFPSVLLVLAIAALLGPSIPAVIVALTVLFVPRLARFARGQTLVVREHLFVEAARAAGASLHRLLARHIVPNIATTMVVEASLAVGSAALIESSISFLGAGVQPPQASWGLMVRTGFGYTSTAPWVALAPGVAILLLTLCANTLGDALRDVFDPKVRL
jgi:peptide/nickel transport system permease protein